MDSNLYSAKGDAVADLHEDIAADQKARELTQILHNTFK
jgi:Mn-containing catalase